MKREVILILFFSVLLFTIFIPLASASETSQVSDAYSCLTNQINESGCSGLSFEQQALSLMAVNECSDEVIAENQTITSSNKTLECWPSSSCTLKLTSLALIGLAEYTNYNITPGENWISSKKVISKDLDWFLEIEADGASSCTIYYPGEEDGVSLEISEDKKLSSSDLGSCLSLAKNDYMLAVSSSCYNEEIDVQCTTGSGGFLTTLLFQKSGSSTLNILSDVQSSSSGGTISNTVESWCLTDSSEICNYEGTMWATQTLFALGEDVSEFLPYLVALAEDNPKYLPESTLYYLTGSEDFLTNLLSKQKAAKYWLESGNRYYDTAFALLSLRYLAPLEKTNSIEWLLGDQGTSGCWNNDNLRDTAFILYSIWPGDYSDSSSSVCGNDIKESGEECDGTDLNDVSCTDLGYESGDLSCYSSTSSGACTFDESDCVVPENCSTDDDCPSGYGCSSGGECIKNSDPTYECTKDSQCSSGSCVNNICVDEADCLSSGYYCLSPVDCSSGDTLSDYSCSSILYTCCKKDVSYGTCSSNGGEICSSSQTCSGTSLNADDISSSETCCSGTCEDSTTTTATCESSGKGICRTSCLTDEKSTAFYTCEFSSEVCCIDNTSSSKNYTWLWILLALVVLVVLGIVFREKLKDFLMKLKTKTKKKPGFGDNNRPLYGGLRPLPPSQKSSAPVQRRIIHPQAQRRTPPRMTPPQKKPTKTSAELEEVLKKLKDLGGK